jgi:uncharacterized glyoxalase superfamily protein PhnB
MYAEIQIGSSRMMMGDANPEWGCKSAKGLGGSPVSFYLYFEDVEAAFRKAKDAGMTETQALKDMFWGDRMGTLRDSLGIDWTLAQHVADPTPEEMEAGRDAMLKEMSDK